LRVNRGHYANMGITRRARYLIRLQDFRDSHGHFRQQLFAHVFPA
jgi:hypothetical protein